MTNVKQLLAAAKAIQADIDACGLGPRKHNAEEGTMTTIQDNELRCPVCGGLYLYVDTDEDDKFCTCSNVGRELVEAERLRLLEAVAEAARAEAQFRHGIGGETFAEWIAQYGYLMGKSTKLALLEALAALEAHDEYNEMPRRER